MGTDQAWYENAFTLIYSIIFKFTMKNDAPNPFYSVQATPEAITRMKTIRDEMAKIYQGIEALVTEDKSINFGPREFALFKTNFEQAGMWLIKAISHYNPAKEEESK